MDGLRQTVQVGTIGAMQRCCPSWTALWLRWVGIPNLDFASFDLVRPDTGLNPSSQITLKPMPGLKTTWSNLCDVLGMPDDAPERDRMPVRIHAQSEYHNNFWGHVIHREMSEVDGPLEWWWHLMILRYRGIRLASKILLSSVFEGGVTTGLVGFVNESVHDTATSADKLLVSGRYRQPSKMVIYHRSNSNSKNSGIELDLSDLELKTRLVKSLVHLAITRVEE